MTLYLDTSNLVKLYIDEPGAEEVATLVRKADVVVTSVIAYAEARAAFARRRLERLMAPADHKAAVQQLNTDWPRFVTIVADDDLARAAGQLAERYRVRGADAIHLASFETLLLRSDDEDVRFSCADERLTRAARSLR